MEPREVKIADGSTNGGRYGLKCAACGEPLVGVIETITSEGFINRKRRCSNPACGCVSITDERVLISRSKRSYNRKLDE